MQRLGPLCREHGTLAPDEFFFQRNGNLKGHFVGKKKTDKACVMKILHKVISRLGK